MHLAVDEPLADHHGAEDVRLAKLELRLRQGPALALADLEKSVCKFIEERAFEGVQDFDAVEREMEAVGQRLDFICLA